MSCISLTYFSGTLHSLVHLQISSLGTYCLHLLFKSLHDSRPMLGAGSSSGVELFQVFMGTRLWQTSRCFMVCSFPHSHVVCPSSLNPHFCIRDLHRPVPVRRRFRFDQVGHVSLEPGGIDSLGVNDRLCGVVWRWLDQRVSL